MRKGHRNQNVVQLQVQLSFLLGKLVYPDGHFGEKTESDVKLFQDIHGLVIDGVVGRNTLGSIAELYKNIDKFIVFVDAGHGGIDPKTGKYTTKENRLGKYAYHKGHNLHDGGWYYEGVENRIVSDKFSELLDSAGIFHINTHHEFRDSGSWELVRRANLVKTFLNYGAYGYLHSFHSNAISSSNTQYKLDNTRGGLVYTTNGVDFSDKIAGQLLAEWQKLYPTEWVWLRDRRGKITTSSDYEANFYILRHYAKYKRFGAILEEHGFHTSYKDCLFNFENRDNRALAAFNTAKWVKANV